MNAATFELREVRPARNVPFQGDVINLENIIARSISTGLFRKCTLTLKLRTGESITYDGLERETIDRLFK